MYEKIILHLLEKHKEGLIRIDFKKKSKKLDISDEKLKKLLLKLGKTGKICVKKTVPPIPEERIKERLTYDKKSIEYLRKNYPRNIYYKPNYEDLVFSHWEIHNKEILNEIKKIDRGFALIEQGVISQKKGLLKRIENRIFDEQLSRSGFLNRYSNIKDDSDFLYIWVENRNPITIEGVDIRIYAPSYHPVTESNEIECHKCNFGVDYHYITIKSEKLLGRDVGIPNDSSYTLIPLKRRLQDYKFEDDEYIPIVSVKYKDVAVGKIKGCRVIKDISNIPEDERGNIIVISSS